MRQYDACFYPVSDGHLLIFGSSSQDFVSAVDLKSGELAWQFVSGGPVRLAPTIFQDRVLFGCDDGNVYCLNKTDGKLIWKFSPSLEKGAEQRMLINNDRLISYYPIRTGVVVRDGVAYFGASMLPWRESYLCAVDVETGQLDGSSKTYVARHEDATLEGNLLVAGNRLIVPQGRIAPMLFERSSGKKLGSLPGGGGVTAVVTEQGDVVRAEGGKASRTGQMSVFRGKERVASFPRGRAMVISGDRFFVIDGQKLFAAHRQTNELLWHCEVDQPLELIQVGQAIIVGGDDHVTAVRASDGQVLWSVEVDGRAFGVCHAQGHLVVSTDQGVIQAFRLDHELLDLEKTQVQNRPPQKWKSPPVPRIRKQNLLHRWVFHRSGMQRVDRNVEQRTIEERAIANVQVQDQASTANLKLQGNATAIRVGESEKLEAVELRGGYFPVPSMPTNRPVNQLTVEAWVRVDVPQQWGSIVGCIQDDGSTEHGWLLGYRSDKFCVAVAGGGNGLTYLSANDAFQDRSWNHVVGTYNGNELRLFVNGSLAASSTAETGPISYSDECFFTVGCYRDTDENFPMKGALQEVRVYSNALSAADITRRFEASASEFGVVLGGNKKTAVAKKPVDRLPNNFLDWGPYTRFVQPGIIEVQYGTREQRPSIIDVIEDDSVRRVESNILSKFHKVTIDRIPHKRQFQFQITAGREGEAARTEPFLVDTNFDWAVDHDPANSFAKQLMQHAPNPRGMVVVVGINQKEKAEWIAQQTPFHVVLVESDSKKAQHLKQTWSADPKVIYGRKLSVVNRPLRELPAAFAAAVISQNQTGEAKRLVRPQGGILHDGSEVTWKRAALKGSGTWSHMYGSADNSAFGGEELAGASDRADLAAQWIGRPGPRYQTDRQNRKPSPLAAGGRLFLQGQQRMIALDNYSGTVLWSVEAPTVMRWNVPHDCSNWCADQDGVFVASNRQAWFIAGRTGEIKKRFDIPSDKRSDHWGYIARLDDDLLGSVVPASAIYTRWWGASQWFDSTGGKDTHVVAAEKLFSMNAKTGQMNWEYEGLVIHPTITIMNQRVYFVESKTPAHQQAATRRLSLDEGQQHELVCLDGYSGKVLWRHALKSFAGHLSSFYLAGGGEENVRCLLLVASEATKQMFTVQSFDPHTGEPKWDQVIAWEANHHGKHISRPAIQGDLVYIRPEVLDLNTGESIHRGFPGGHGCSSYTASANGIFARLGETTWWDVRTQKVNRFKRIRTDCWLSVIPAQGMLISAEGGGGCSCGSWLETSLGFLPRSVSEERPDD